MIPADVACDPTRRFIYSLFQLFIPPTFKNQTLNEKMKWEIAVYKHVRMHVNV